MSELKKRLLLALRKDKAVSLNDLERITGSHASSISRSIQSLRKEGFVEEQDYVLTDKGNEVKEELAEKYAEKLEKWSPQ